METETCAATWEGLSPPYATIVADPPWHYEASVSIPGGNRASGPAQVKPLAYSTMTVQEIASMPVIELAAADCWLFLWTTNAYLPAAFTVVAAWGFAYRQTLLWRKTGNPSPFGGSLAPNHAEFLLAASVGNPVITSRLRGSVIDAPKQRAHSRKPAVFLDAVESLTEGPYLELFARRQRLGWDSWGYGYEGTAG